MLEIKNVSLRYGTKKALDGVTVSFAPGQIVGLLGENGAGKTSLLKAILGLLPFSGEVLLDGESVTRRNIARLSFATCEHSFFPSLTPRAHRDFYAQHFPGFLDRRFQALMDFFALPDSRPVRALSAGQKNQFEVILALSQGADYILMDEPFAGNDIFNREDFYKVLLGILEPGETVILSTHLIQEIRDFVSRAVLIRRGRIVGDLETDELEESGTDLVEAVKASYGYEPDRAARALDSLTGRRGEGQP